MLTADQYVQKVEDKLLRQVLGTDGVRNLSYDHVNDGIRALLTGFPFTWALDDDTNAANTITIASQDYIVPLPSETLELRSVERWTLNTPGSQDTEARKLREKSLEWFSRNYPNLPAQIAGRPLWWTRTKYGQILIAPPADQTYYIHIRRTRLPAPLAAGSGTVSIIPDQYDRGVIAFAISAGFEVLRQYTNAKYWKDEFLKWQALAVQEDKNAPDLEFIGESFTGPGSTSRTIPDNYWTLPDYRGDPSS